MKNNHKKRTFYIIFEAVGMLFVLASIYPLFIGETYFSASLIMGLGIIATFTSLLVKLKKEEKKQDK